MNTEESTRLYFYLAGVHDLAAMLQRLTQALEGGQWSKRVNAMGTFTFVVATSRFSLEAHYLIDTHPMREQIARDLGFSPTLELSWFFPSDAPPAVAITSTPALKWVGQMLRGVADDAALLSDERELLLKRAQGEVYLNQSDAFWTPLHRSQLNLSHEFRPLSIQSESRPA